MPAWRGRQAVRGRRGREQPGSTTLMSVSSTQSGCVGQPAAFTTGDGAAKALPNQAAGADEWHKTESPRRYDWD